MALSTIDRIRLRTEYRYAQRYSVRPERPDVVEIKHWQTLRDTCRELGWDRRRDGMGVPRWAQEQLEARP